MRATAFHSRSAGGRLLGLLKYTSYSIFRRRSSESRCVSSSSMVNGRASAHHSVGRGSVSWQMPGGHEGRSTKVIGPAATGVALPAGCRSGAWESGVFRSSAGGRWVGGVLGLAGGGGVARGGWLGEVGVVAGVGRGEVVVSYRGCAFVF